MFACLESEIGRVRRQERNETEEIKKRWHNKPPDTLACCQVGIAEAPVERHSDCEEKIQAGSTKKFHTSVLNDKINQLIEAI